MNFCDPAFVALMNRKRVIPPEESGVAGYFMADCTSGATSFIETAASRSVGDVVQYTAGGVDYCATVQSASTSTGTAITASHSIANCGACTAGFVNVMTLTDCTSGTVTVDGTGTVGRVYAYTLANGTTGCGTLASQTSAASAGGSVGTSYAACSTCANPTGSNIEIEICGGSTVYIVADCVDTSHSSYYAPSVGDVRIFQHTATLNYYCGTITAVSVGGTSVGNLQLDSTSGSYTCTSCNSDLTTSANVQDCVNTGNVYMINTGGGSFSVNDIVTYSSSAHSISNASGKVTALYQGLDQSGTSMSSTSHTTCAGALGYVDVATLTDCTSGTVTVDGTGTVGNVHDYTLANGTTGCGTIASVTNAASVGGSLGSSHADCSACGGGGGGGGGGSDPWLVDDCNGGGNSYVDMGGSSVSVGDYVSWTDSGGTAYCAEILSQGSYQTTVGTLSSTYIDCDECNTSEGLDGGEGP